MYQIVRIFYKGAVEQHSIEERTTEREALSRFHSIIAADVGNTEITYSYVALINENGQYMVSPFIYNTINDEETDEPIYPFEFAVLRVRVKNNTRSTSVEFNSYAEVIKRFFNILAADLNDNEVTYNFGMVISSDGKILETRVFQ